MATQPDHGGHVPSDLIYGPVASRRFGRSLGVSFSRPGGRACQWSCPYCQLGHLPTDRTAEPVPPVTILADLDRILVSAGELDCLTVAGGGEPTDHPDCAALLAALRQRGAAAGLRLVLLTNADGLGQTCTAADLAGFEVQVKWDPGIAHGAWRRWRGDRDRAAHLAPLRPLTIQALLYDGPGGGNTGAADLRSWQDQLQAMDLAAIHLTTVDRPAPKQSIRPVAAEQLRRWAEATESRLGVPVHWYPARAIVA